MSNYTIKKMAFSYIFIIFHYFLINVLNKF